jgi:hypothetical protein
MLQEFAKIKYYIAAILVALAVYMWAGLTGTRLLGDDSEKTKNTGTSYGQSRYSGRGYSSSHHYHK